MCATLEKVFARYPCYSSLSHSSKRGRVLMRRIIPLGLAKRASRQQTSRLSIIAALVTLLCIGGCSNSEAAGPADAAAMDSAADANSEECLPSNDMCPTDEYCEYTSGRLQCVAERAFSSPLQADPLTECPDGVCARGFVCMVDTRGSSRATCYQACTLGLGEEPIFGVSDCTITRHTCAPAIGEDGEPLPFGLCYYGAP